MLSSVSLSARTLRAASRAYSDQKTPKHQKTAIKNHSCCLSSFQIVFRNLASRPYNIYPHGLTSVRPYYPMRHLQGKTGHGNLGYHLDNAIFLGHKSFLKLVVHLSKHLSSKIPGIMMILGSCSHWCHVTLPLRRASVMTGRRDISNQGAETVLLGPSWKPPLSDKAGTILVILAVFAFYLQPSLPGLPLTCICGGVHCDLDSPSCSFVVFALGLFFSFRFHYQNCFYPLLLYSQDHDLCRAIPHPIRILGWAWEVPFAPCVVRKTF